MVVLMHQNVCSVHHDVKTALREGR